MKRGPPIHHPCGIQEGELGSGASPQKPVQGSVRKTLGSGTVTAATARWPGWPGVPLTLHPDDRPHIMMSPRVSRGTAAKPVFLTLLGDTGLWL